MTIDIQKALALRQLLGIAYNVAPTDLLNRVGTTYTVDGITYKCLSTVYANDLATDANGGAREIVSMGMVFQSSKEITVVIRGTETLWEWLHDAKFSQVPCPIIPGSGNVDDGFFEMFQSLRADPNSDLSLSESLLLLAEGEVTDITITGHSLGAPMAVFLAMAVANGTMWKNPTCYQFEPPHPGNNIFQQCYAKIIPNTVRICVDLDIVTMLPFGFGYGPVGAWFQLHPGMELKLDPHCRHSLDTVAHYLAKGSNRESEFPLNTACANA